MKSKDTIIIGIGNPNMGDDAIGIEIVNSIKKDVLAVDTEVLFYISFEILDKILGYQNAIIVDAADLDIELGDYLLINFKTLSRDFSIKNTHGISIFHIISIGYELFNDNMPDNIFLLLIQTKSVECFSKEISKELVKKIPCYIEKIKNLI